jgi:hypothetical protein
MMFTRSCVWLTILTFLSAGGVQYALYVPIFSRLFPAAGSFAVKPWAQKVVDYAGQRAVFAQVFLDQFLHHPLMYFPSFYMTREVIQHGLSLQSAQDALSKYRVNMKEDMLACWKVWVPVTIMNFTFSPMWMRIPVVATTSLAWTCILSAMRGASTIVDVPSEDKIAMDSIMIGKEVIRSLSTNKSERPQLDPKKTHVVLTAVGAREKGTLRRLLEAVLHAKGNVVESRLEQYCFFISFE